MGKKWKQARHSDIPADARSEATLIKAMKTYPVIDESARQSLGRLQIAGQSVSQERAKTLVGHSVN